MPSVRRFHAEETDACFTVRDANGHALAYVYSEEPGRRAAAKLLTRDEARHIAGNVGQATGAAAPFNDLKRIGADRGHLNDLNELAWEEPR